MNHTSRLFKRLLAIPISGWKSKIYFRLAIFSLVMGMVNGLTSLLPWIRHNEIMLRKIIFDSLFFCLVGFLSLSFCWLKRGEIKNGLAAILLLITIPATLFNFVEYASTTVWVYPVIVMFMLLLFTSKIPLVVGLIFNLASQILIWMYLADDIVVIDEFDFFFRIRIVFIVFIVGFIVNDAHNDRIKESVQQMKFQKIISESTLTFLNISKADLNKIINELLKRAGELLNVDRAYAFILDNNNNTLSYTHEWCNEGIKPEVGSIEKEPLESYKWWIDNLEKNRYLYVEDVKKMDDDCLAEKEQLLRQNIKSTVAVSIGNDKEMIGFVGFDSVRKITKFTYQIEVLQSLANILASGILKLRSEEEVKRLAYYDHLTGLPNRVMFKDMASAAIELAKESSCYLGVMFIDLDNFKFINDTMGHRVGDELLIDVAKRLESKIRKTDVSARFGGDEFLIILNHVSNLYDFDEVAGKIIAIFEEPFILNGQEYGITCSGGIAIYPDHGENVDVLIKNADIAMFRAKSKGKNRYFIYE